MISFVYTIENTIFKQTHAKYLLSPIMNGIVYQMRLYGVYHYLCWMSEMREYNDHIRLSMLKMGLSLGYLDWSTQRACLNTIVVIDGNLTATILLH